MVDGKEEKVGVNPEVGQGRGGEGERGAVLKCYQLVVSCLVCSVRVIEYMVVTQREHSL